MRIYLIRHGRTQGNYEKRLIGRTQNLVLTDFGILQVAVLGSQLQNLKVDHLRVSPLLRATQTSKLLLNFLQANTVTCDDDLIERDFGIFEGLDRKALLKKKEDFGISEKGSLIHYFPNHIGGVEEDRSVHKRILNKLCSDMELYGENATVAYITHAGVIEAFLRVQMGIPDTKEKTFKIREASFMTGEFDSDGSFLVTGLWNNDLMEEV